MAWRSGQSYSADLRMRVLAAIDGGGSAKAVAQLFRVSVSYIYKALARRGATGETEARLQRNRQTLKLAGHHPAIQAEVARRPDVTLDELRAWLLATHKVMASLGLMHKTLARLGLTLKKVGASRGAGPGGRGPAAVDVAGQATRDESGAADLHRRARGCHQPGAARSLPRTRSGGRSPRGHRLDGPLPHGHVWTPPRVQEESPNRMLRATGCCHVSGL